jgi:hypothetical protein
MGLADPPTIEVRQLLASARVPGRPKLKRRLCRKCELEHYTLYLRTAIEPFTSFRSW